MTIDFRISDREIDSRTHLVELGGEVDLYTAPEFKERLSGAIESGKQRLVVDLSETTFIDSTTLGVLVGAEKQLRASDGAVVLVCPERNIRKVFEITGLDRVFTMHDSRDEALADASGEPAG
ncbi:MAG: STAS domain-containing protein [Thermoleophilaceae bacterium]|nr:STAS domain-containing protein [Thermoleophilaceae bacterium]